MLPSVSASRVLFANLETCFLGAAFTKYKWIQDELNELHSSATFRSRYLDTTTTNFWVAEVKSPLGRLDIVGTVGVHKLREEDQQLLPVEYRRNALELRVSLYKQNVSFMKISFITFRSSNRVEQ